MRISRDDVVIDGVAWQVARVSRVEDPKVGAHLFQGLEFRVPGRIRRLALTNGEMLSVQEFRALPAEVLAGLFRDAYELS